MDLDIIFAGTSASVPTPQRGLSSVLVRRGGEQVLVDCGEGTQRQLMKSCGLTTIDVLLVTHLHADHVLGIPGILKTFGLRDRVEPFIIAGPVGLSGLLTSLGRVIGKLSYDLDVLELSDGDAIARDGWHIDAFETQHTVRSVGWRIVEEDRPGRFDLDEARRLGVPDGPSFGVLQRGGDVTLDDGVVVTSTQVVGQARCGRRLVFTGDTRATQHIRDAATDADVLVHEATFMDVDNDRARATGHSTALDAALTAVAADVRMLALTHISTRYRVRDLLDEAGTVCDVAVCPRDFDLIEVPFRERGGPKLIARGGKDRAGPAQEDVVPEAAGSA